MQAHTLKAYKDPPMTKETISEILLWLFSAAIVAIVSIRLIVDSWLLVRRVKIEMRDRRKPKRKAAALNILLQ